MTLVPAFRPRPSALHAARVGASAGFCLALALVTMLFDHPVVLASALAAVVVAGARAGVAAELRAAARLAVPLALLVLVVNPLVTRGGDTLLIRGGEFLGRRWDVTLEAVTYGGLAGLRVLVLVLVFGLFSAAVDPDEMLRLLRRVSPRSALTAALATRLVPVLARDAARMSDAARCRRRPPGRAAVARAALRGALDRAVDVAAALEVRGFGASGRPRRVPRRWSRHDVRVTGAAGGLILVTVAARISGVAELEAYPTLRMSAGPAEALLAGAIVVLAATPFAGARGRLGIAGGRRTAPAAGAAGAGGAAHAS